MPKRRAGRMEKIILTLSDTATDFHCQVMKRIARDLAKEYKCEVIIRNLNYVVLHKEVYCGEKEEERRELGGC